MSSPMHSSSPVSLLRVEDLAERIHKSVASIRSDVSRNPHALPPLCRLPGTKRLLWREEDVSRWLAAHVVSSNDVSDEKPIPATKSRRGRPTKAEQLRRMNGRR